MNSNQLGTPGPFPDALSEFIYTRTYSRWLPDAGRRETWGETCTRVVKFLCDRAGIYWGSKEYNDLFGAIYLMHAMPSMRLMWSAGKTAAMNNVTAYNCSYIEVKDIQAFAEILYILMCGTGVGAGVEEESVSQLPRVKRQKQQATSITYTIADSREGWADALAFGMKAWCDGDDTLFDYGALRPAGARLKTMGGRSSGPAPLKRLLDFTRDRILTRQGRRLRTIDAGDIINMIGECVVSGGVRRSSEILLFSPDDKEMASAKHGAYWNAHPYRAMANNSGAWNDKPSTGQFLQLWDELYSGKSGEPGLYNRQNVRSTAPRRRKWPSWGTNPCGEINLRGDHPRGGGQFCNLSEVVCRADDTLETLTEKVRLAAIFGTIQSTLTDFPYLRPGWKANCEDERLLGVSATGQADCPQWETYQAQLREVAIATNKEWAARLGIAQSAAVTCVKPSGTAAKLVGSSSGLHTRWAPFYLQRVRVAATDPLLAMLRDQGVPCVPETGQIEGSATTYVTEWPIKSPTGAVTRHDRTALQQLETWRRSKTEWCEHNPSCTIYVKEDEWIDVLSWVDRNWHMIGGLSFFPASDHVYPLAPYQEITEEEYEKALSTFPAKLDYSRLSDYEKDDNTTGSRELACAGGLCEL